MEMVAVHIPDKAHQKCTRSCPQSEVSYSAVALQTRLAQTGLHTDHLVRKRVKLKIMCKTEFILISGIDSNASSEEMLKKIQELNSLLEARETKLFELSKINVELQENNVELRR